MKPGSVPPDDMALQELQGTTLGQKKKRFNELVKKAIDGDDQIQAQHFNPADNDVTNLMKIDVAGKKRNVEFILNILQGDDMLYVSRAIKQSKWLLNDRQYSHIINPRYLQTQLFPNMTSKARAKLLLHVRINLKDEDRVEDFYNFNKEKNIHAALSWLPHCSISFIELEVQKHHKNIKVHLLKRLYKKSITILEIMIKYTSQYKWRKECLLEETMFLLNSDTGKYLDIIESEPYPYTMPHFGPKATSILMKNCPQRIIENLEIYCNKIHVHTFAKHFKPEKIKEFIFQICKNKEMQSWLIYGNIHNFVRYLPTEERYDFIKEFLIDKGNDEEMKSKDERRGQCITNNLKSTANIYQWYRFAPFKVAFADLTKLIRTKSAPPERSEMFGVLLSCANRNPQDIETILQYYNDRHINENFKFKIQFVNMLLTKTDTYRFNETAWNTLNNIFYSMDVYVESENNVQACIEAIILYKLLHNAKIPEIIEKKFQFQSMKSIKKKFTDEERNTVFDFLYKTLKCKIENNNINSEIELTETVHLLENVQTLLTDWNKNPVDFPWFLDKVKELIKLKSDNAWKANLSTLFTKNKSWRRTMFEESLMLCPSEETCYNALKHDPELMTRNKSTVEQLRHDDNVSLRRVLRALRVYWPQTLAADWLAWYLGSLNKPSSHKSVIRGLCTLATQQQLTEILKKYAPTESKINWREDDEVVLNIRKHLARNMYVSRPLLSPELMLLYAKGSYLQFSLPSIIAVFNNMSAAQTGEHLSKFLDAPVSLQKHAIRFAFTKLESEDLKKVLHGILKNSKNVSIRKVLFKQTYDLLCRQTDPIIQQEVCELLDVFMENLSTEEHKTIYKTLTNYKEVPRLVRGKFIMQSFKFLKSFPRHERINVNTVHVNNLFGIMTDHIDHLDPEFVMDVLLEFVDEIFTMDNIYHYYPNLMASYLLCSKSVENQTQKYIKVLLPVLERAFKLWDERRVANNTYNLLSNLTVYFQRFAFEKKMVFPTKLFSDIQTELATKLPTEKNYGLQTTWKLYATYVRLLEEHKEILDTIQSDPTESDEEWTKNKVDCCHYYNPQEKKKWNEIYIKALPEFSKMCLGYLQEDVNKYFPSICWLFASSLYLVFHNINTRVYLECLEYLLVDEEFIPSFLVVLENADIYLRGDVDECQKILIRIRKKIMSHSSPEVKVHYVRKYPGFREPLG